MRAERSRGGRAGGWAGAQGSVSTQELADHGVCSLSLILGFMFWFDVLYAYPSILIPFPPQHDLARNSLL